MESVECMKWKIGKPVNHRQNKSVYMAMLVFRCI